MTERVVKVWMRSMEVSGGLRLVKLVQLAGSSVGIAAVGRAVAVPAGGKASDIGLLLFWLWRGRDGNESCSGVDAGCARATG